MCSSLKDIFSFAWNKWFPKTRLNPKWAQQGFVEGHSTMLYSDQRYIWHLKRTFDLQLSSSIGVRVSHQQPDHRLAPTRNHVEQWLDTAASGNPVLLWLRSQTGPRPTIDHRSSYHAWCGRACPCTEQRSASLTSAVPWAWTLHSTSPNCVQVWEIW